MSVQFTDDKAKVDIEIIRESPNKFDKNTSYTVVERATNKYFEVVLDENHNIQKAELSTFEYQSLNSVQSRLKKAKAKEKKALEQGLWGRLN